MTNKNISKKSGLTVVEIVVALAILAILAGIGMRAFTNARTAKQLDTITDSIATKLEEAKTNAMSGKDGTNFGLAFSTTTYTYWSGTSYSPSAESNNVFPISSNFSLTSTIPGTYHAVRFARITGTPDLTGSIVITSNDNASTTDTITIGALGDITVIK